MLKHHLSQCIVYPTIKLSHLLVTIINYYKRVLYLYYNIVVATIVAMIVRGVATGGRGICHPHICHPQFKI